jgi:hypothetical protein
MDSVAKSTVPRVPHSVRRRRYGDEAWLVRHNEWFAVDAEIDDVWLACEEGLTIERIVHRIAERHALPLGDAIATTSTALGQLLELGLIELPA